MEDELTGTTTGQAPKYIITKDKDGTFQIILNNPPMNVFNIQMIEEINDALSHLMYRNDLKVVVFITATKQFCGGISPQEFAEEKSYQMIESLGRMFQQLKMISIPTLCVVQGVALGPGFELVLFSDFAIASETAKFGLPEIRIGLFPAVGANILQRCLPAKKAAELLLMGEIITAREAEKYGLLNAAVPEEKLQEQAGVFVGKLLQFSGPVLQLCKKAISDSSGKNFEEGQRAVEEVYLTQLLALSDPQEGIRAFMEKRKPVWKNE